MHNLDVQAATAIRRPRGKVAEALMTTLGVGSVLMLVILVKLSPPPIDWIRWRLHNQAQISVSGRTFDVPILWTTSRNDDGVLLFRQYWFESTDGITIHSGGKVMEHSAALDKQQRQVAFLNSQPHNRNAFSIHVINGHTLEFICIQMSVLGPEGISLDCIVPGTDLRLMILTSGRHFARTESILTSAR